MDWIASISKKFNFIPNRSTQASFFIHSTFFSEKFSKTRKPLVYRVGYLNFAAEVDFEDGYDDERDHLRLPLFSEEAVASVDKMALVASEGGHHVL